MTPILIKFFSMFNECRVVTSPQICDVTSVEWYEHNIIYVAKTKELISCVVTAHQLRVYRAADMRNAAQVFC